MPIMFYYVCAGESIIQIMFWGFIRGGEFNNTNYVFWPKATTPSFKFLIIAKKPAYLSSSTLIPNQQPLCKAR